MVASAIAPETLCAYTEATYTVIRDDGQVLTFRIEEASADLRALLTSHSAPQACFVTACNPRSEVLGDEANQVRQEELVRHCTELSIAFLRGHSHDSSAPNEWLEHSLFLFCDVESGKRLGHMFDQNSIVEISGDGLPSLVNLR